MTFAHSERAEEQAADVDIERHAEYLADASMVDVEGREVLTRAQVAALDYDSHVEIERQRKYKRFEK